MPALTTTPKEKVAAGTNRNGLRPVGEIFAPMMRRLLSIKRARDAD